MATTITNAGLIERGQKAVLSFSGFDDSTKAFIKGFNSTALYGNGVSVPVITTGAVNTSSMDFATDDSNSIVFKNVVINKSAKTQFVLPGYQAAQLEPNFNQMIDAMLLKVSKQITDTAYAMFNVTKWPVASNKVVVAAWSETAPTLTALYSCVEAAKKTGKLDPNGIKVLMPSATYGLLKGALDSLPREAALGFEVIPVYAASITQTCITDTSAVALAIGADIGVGPEQFEYITNADNSIGFGIHIIEDDKLQNITVAVRATYAVEYANDTAFLWFANA